MTAVLAQVHEAVLAADADDDLDMDPTLRACVQRSLAGPHLAPAAEPVTPPPLTMSAFGMQLHAATTVDGCDRQQLERLCRYLLRPPFAHDAVKALEDGRVRVHFKAPWRRGIGHGAGSASAQEAPPSCRACRWRLARARPLAPPGPIATKCALERVGSSVRGVVACGREWGRGRDGAWRGDG